MNVTERTQLTEPNKVYLSTFLITVFQLWSVVVISHTHTFASPRDRNTLDFSYLIDVVNKALVERYYG